MILASDVVIGEFKRGPDGSKQMWKFSDTVILGKHAQMMADGEDKGG
jgi:hypothetical protein